MIQTMFLAILYLSGVIATYYIIIYHSSTVTWGQWACVLGWPLVMIYLGLAVIHDFLIGR